MSENHDPGLNAWVRRHPPAGIAVGLVFVLLGVAIFVNEDGSGRYSMDGIWPDYILAPLAVLVGLGAIFAAIVRLGRQR